ncbi:MAG TPA: response regulator [Bryobacteraceae bacterium]|jgi:two-component system chemotaxis response regulator CheY|nr:response regulator [Bryobacteraceae bacterium]
MPNALVVDDSRAIRMILSRTLRELGFDVREAGNGADALAALGAGPAADLVMADWNMPVMDGLELLRRIRASTDFPAVPVIMVTTEAEIGQMAAALEAGATEYIMKPFTTEILAGKLRMAGLVE